MHKKALTVVIAGALAAPMAAQAVDVSVSGHVARALVVTDKSGSGGSDTVVEDWGSSPSRFRMSGSGEIMDGGASAGVFLELGEKGNMRQSHVFFSGDFGKIALGDASDAADSRAYSDKSGVFVAHGQEEGTITTGAYFNGLSGGTTEGLHYTSPSFGAGKLEASAGNDDRWSMSAVIDTSVGGCRDSGRSRLSGLRDGREQRRRVSRDQAGGRVYLVRSVGQEDQRGGGRLRNGEIRSQLLPVDGGIRHGEHLLRRGLVPLQRLRERGLQGTIVGAGVNHNFPKANAHIFASAQQFKAEDDAGEVDSKDTVFVVGSRVRF